MLILGTFSHGRSVDNFVCEKSTKIDATYHSSMNLPRSLLRQVLHYLSTVTFTTNTGERVYFDSNGDSPARYELVNLQKRNKETMEGTTVGIYDASLPESHQFIMNSIPVSWGSGQTKVGGCGWSVHCNVYPS